MKIYELVGYVKLHITVGLTKRHGTSFKINFNVLFTKYCW